MDGIKAGAAFPVTINVSGINLTTATEIWFTLAWRGGESPIPSIPVKTKTSGAITVAYDGPTNKSIVTLVLSATETLGLTTDVVYALYVNDGTPGGEWIPDNGGDGPLKVSKPAKKA